jgi:hypothetical protein
MNLVEIYETITLSIGEETGASDSLLHVHAGMAVLMVARIISGRSLATPVPFLIVCLFALANEVLDRISHGSWLWVDTGLDLLNTIFWPFVLMVGLRMRRSREARRVEQPN